MQYIGGSFAPPLNAAKLAEYRALAESASPEVKDAMLGLCKMMAAWHQQPVSALPGKPHPATARANIVLLEPPTIKELWEHVPWPKECNYMAELFEEIPNDTQKPLRDAAFHLLWFAKELSIDREPLTADKLV